MQHFIQLCNFNDVDTYLSFISVAIMFEGNITRKMF